RRGAGASGVPIALAEGQTSPDLALAMTPTGAIAGRVFEHGRPVRSAWVRAFRPRYFDGERGLTLADWTQTDDRGEYRLFGLAPGAYFVTPMPRDRPRIGGAALIEWARPTIANGNRSEIRTPLSLAPLTASAFGGGTYPVLFYPSGSDASAAIAVEVRAGETTPGIDFAVAAVHTFHVRGR